MNSNLHIFLDIDGVLTTTKQYHSNPRKWHDEYDLYPFDFKCVKVFNDIIKETNPIIILSSDWQTRYTLEVLNRIFEINGVKTVITDVTGTAWGNKFKSLSQIEECRAYDILQYVKKNNINKFLAIDDLWIDPWMPENTFQWIPRIDEGIKQSGVKEKILKLIRQ